MEISSRAFEPLFAHRKRSIDPAKHFAVRIKDGYADTVTREQFLNISYEVIGMASLLKKLAAAVSNDAAKMFKTGEFNDGVRLATEHKLAHAKRMQSEFESYVRQLVFNDQAAFAIVHKSRNKMSEAIADMKNALHTVDVSRNKLDQKQLPRFRSASG
ncbi:MAG: hypothetical protein GY789_07995 [Hyphomicrobiales bacterium]|nr:hypothetical protein [Hyphomicrobiales bacterium]MCP4998032.1 hypothetical protein [Hyphomicrobiales bacterium]